MNFLSILASMTHWSLKQYVKEMNIGEQIIAAIENGKLQSIDDIWGGVKISFKPSAAEQLEAVVEAHIEERVRVRLELDRQAIRAMLPEDAKKWLADGILPATD